MIVPCFIGGFATFSAGIAINIKVAKAKFERRNRAGVEESPSYWQAWKADAVELICRGITIAFFIATFCLLFKAFVPD